MARGAIFVSFVLISRLRVASRRTRGFLFIGFVLPSRTRLATRRARAFLLDVVAIAPRAVVERIPVGDGHFVDLAIVAALFALETANLVLEVGQLEPAEIALGAAMLLSHRQAKNPQRFRAKSNNFMLLKKA